MGAVFATTSVQDFISTMSEEDFNKYKILKENPEFCKFVDDPNFNDPISMFNFVEACKAVEVPEQYTRSSSGLHYLAKAILARS